ncbi:hypothetical protein BJ170DRAFT_697387 [Xylariales sp. AK1849]|nr:hypothetical protein BJ170DRAFT_697387 [Xylariales sp. AK1849]
MQSNHSFTAWRQFFVSLWLLVGSVQAKCNADNCYRALFPCRSAAAWSSASAFCATIITGGTTAIDYPTRATAACGLAPDRYISACTCGPTCTPIPSSTPCPVPTGGNIVPNGDFECGLPPWTVQVPDPSAAYSVTSPGHTGNKAFEIDLVSSPSTPDFGVNARIISPGLSVVSGNSYQLRFWANFNDLRCGFIGIMIEDQPVFTVDATDHGAASIGTWTENIVDYTPTTSTISIKFEYLLGPALCHVKTDTITFTPLH